MLPNSGTIFISTTLPDGTVKRTPLPVAREYFVDSKGNPRVVNSVSDTDSVPKNTFTVSSNYTKPPVPTNINRFPLPGQDQNSGPGTAFNQTPKAFSKSQDSAAGANKQPVNFHPKPFIFPEVKFVIDEFEENSDKLPVISDQLSVETATKPKKTDITDNLQPIDSAQDNPPASNAAGATDPTSPSLPVGRQGYAG